MLVSAQEGQLSPDEFITKLIDEQLFMPIYEKHQIQGFQPTTDQVKPLSIKDENAADILILFTGPERAADLSRILS